MKNTITAPVISGKPPELKTKRGKRWTSTIDNNVWAPGVYGWEVEK